MTTFTLYGCGYNGFSQISGFQAEDLDGWVCGSGKRGTSIHNENTNTCIASPVALMCLAKSVEVKNVLFTWSGIAVALHKDGRDLSLVAGGGRCDAHNTSKDRKVCSRNDGEAISATDTHVFLRLEGMESTKYVSLRDGVLHPLSLVCEDESARPGSDSTAIQLHASHADVYYSRGATEFGRLTCASPDTKGGNQFARSVRLSPVDFSVRVAQVSCGREHVLILSTFGSLYTCGLGSRGQLGHGDVEMELTPRLVEALEGVRMLSCEAGGWHSTCVSECGDVYAWGWNERGQLGLAVCSDSQQQETRAIEPQAPGLVVEPQCVTLPQDVRVMAVACGSRHTLVLSECGQVFSCGWNAYGQLGLMHTNNQSAFLKVASLASSCSRIFAGHWGSVFLCLK